MKHLKIDYTMSNGHQMTIEGALPFTSQEMNTLEMNMLAANTIHTLLPIAWNEIDNEITYLYHIQQYKLLTHYYQPHSITMLDYYSLLLSLVDVLATCYDYMLRPQCCILDEKLIYIDLSSNSIRLAYLPLRDTHEVTEYQLLLLAVRWSQLVDHLQYEGYQKILQLIGSQQFPINPLRQLLLDLIHQLNTNHEIEILPHVEAVVPAAVQFHMKEQANIMKDSNSVGFDRGSEEVELDDWESDTPNDEKPSFTWKHYTAIALIIVIVAMSWTKLYLAEATKSNFLLSCGITLILLTGILIMLRQHWKVLWYRKQDDDQHPFEFVTTSDPQNPQPSFLSPSREVSIPRSTVNNFEVPVSRVPQVAARQATVMLDAHHSTTILGSMSSNAEPLLIRKLYQEEEKIIVNDNRFLIGRADEGVHYQDSASGVSRVHLEVELGNGTVHIKDVGSRNGSYLNGKLMIAYKAYPLQVGDVVQLVNTEGPQYQLVG